MSSIEQLLQVEENSDFNQDLLQSEAQYLNAPSNVQTKFNYAYNLIRSARPYETKKGRDLLQDLQQSNPNNREYLYYLAIVSFKLELYTDARNYTHAMLKQEPNNRQALQLDKMINDKVTKEGLTGMLIAGGAVATVGLATALLIALVAKRK